MFSKNFNKKIIIFILFLIFGGIISCIMRAYPCYDLFSYHMYNGWAFLNDRINTDFMAASFRTYFNPLMDALNFKLLESLNEHPVIFMFISGFKYGIFLFLSFLLFDKLFINKGINKTFTIIFCLLAVFFTPIITICMSFDWNDIQIAGLVLLSIYLYIICIFKPLDKKKLTFLFLTGLILGISTGIKHTVAVFSLSVIICTIINYKKIPDILKTITILIAGMLLGYIVFDGFWIYKIYKHFQNPFFPYFNNIFKSPLGNMSSVLSYDFAHLRASHISDYFLYPFKNSLYNYLGIEAKFFDLKIASSSLMIVFYLFLRFGNSIKQTIEEIIEQRYFDTIIILIIATYFINLSLFGAVRYIIALFPLCAIVIVVLLYLYSKYLNSAKISLWFCLAWILLMALCQYKYTNPYSLKIFLVLISIISVIAIFYVYLSKEIVHTNKNYFLILLFSVLLFAGITRFIDYTKAPKDWNKNNVINIQKANIKDNSVVLCGTMTACFVAPFQNPNAKYISFALQPEFQKMRNDLDSTRTGAHIEYTSPYLISLIKKIFTNEENLYIIISMQDISKNGEAVMDIYRKSVAQYSDNQIPDLYKDCKYIDYKILNYSIDGDIYFICKLHGQD